MSDAYERISAALNELFAEGPRRSSLVSRYMAESAWDDDLIELVRSHHSQLYDAAFNEQRKRHPREPATALSKASDQTLSLLFRMAFEAGRVDERNEALTLHQLVGLED